MKKLFIIIILVLLCSTIFAGINDGLVAYYPLNGNVNDESGNGYNGTDYDGSYSIDRFGNANSCASLDGNDYIKLPDAVRFKPLVSSSLSFWIKTSQTDRFDLFNQRIGNNTPSNANFGIVMNAAYLGLNGIEFFYPGYNNDTYLNIFGNFANNQWTHYVFVKDTSTRKMKAYENNILIGEMNITDVNYTISGSLFIGKHYANILFYTGLIDDVRIYNRSILASEVQELFTDSPLPVVLSHFAAIQTSNNFAQINWTTQSETNLLGYNLYRNIENSTNGSQKINPQMIYGENSASGSNYSYTDESVEYEQPYFYWLESVELSGNSELFGPVSITLENPENNAPELPNVTNLRQNYPNPFNPTTTIKFSIQENETGMLSIYNAKGQLIETENYSTGEHSYLWNADNLTSGIYFYKLQTKSFKQIKKMILMK